MITKKRGDTFCFPFKTKNDKVIESGSTIKCGVKTSEDTREYALISEEKAQEDITEITFVFPASETKNLIPSGDLELLGLSYILEVEITTKDGYVETPYQEILKIERDYIHD